MVERKNAKTPKAALRVADALEQMENRRRKTGGEASKKRADLDLDSIP